MAKTRITVRVQISLPKELLEQIDQYAEEDLVTRSEFLRQSAQDRILTTAKKRRQLAAIVMHPKIPRQDELLELLNFKHEHMRAWHYRQAMKKENRRLWFEEWQELQEESLAKLKEESANEDKVWLKKRAKQLGLGQLFQD